MSEEPTALPAGCVIEERVVVETGTVNFVRQQHGVQLPGKQGWHFAGFMNQHAKERELFQCDNKSHTAIKEKTDPLKPLLKREELFKFNNGGGQMIDIRDVQTNAKGDKKKKTKGRRCCLFLLRPGYEAISPEEFARRCAEQDQPLLDIFADTSRDIVTRKRALRNLVQNFCNERKSKEAILATVLLMSNVENEEALALLTRAVSAGETLDLAEVLECVPPHVDENEPVGNVPVENARPAPLPSCALPASPGAKHVESHDSDDVASSFATPSTVQSLNGASTVVRNFGSNYGDNDDYYDDYPLDGDQVILPAPDNGGYLRQAEVCADQDSLDEDDSFGLASLRYPFEWNAPGNESPHAFLSRRKAIDANESAAPSQSPSTGGNDEAMVSKDQAVPAPEANTTGAPMILDSDLHAAEKDQLLSDSTPESVVVMEILNSLGLTAQEMDHWAGTIANGLEVWMCQSALEFVLILLESYFLYVKRDCLRSANFKSYYGVITCSRWEKGTLEDVQWWRRFQYSHQVSDSVRHVLQHAWFEKHRPDSDSADVVRNKLLGKLQNVYLEFWYAGDDVVALRINPLSIPQKSKKR